MAGNSKANDSDYLEDYTVVLVGCTGSGKSATGNSILGWNEFTSMSCFGRVTTTCKRRSCELEDRRILNVIDTPGLFDSTSKPQQVEKEIVRCMDMAKEGIHAVLMVLSLKVRFTDEQASVVETMKHLFGAGIVDYMIIVFTGGDDLDEGETLDSRLARTCPDALKELLKTCGNRKVVFDNKTKDKATKTEQREQLVTLINSILVKNGGKPYTSDLFDQLKKEAEERDRLNPRRRRQNIYDEEKMYQRMGEMIQEKLREKDEETIKKLKQDMEKVKREARERIREQEEARNEVRQLRIKLGKAQREAEERWRCEIL